MDLPDKIKIEERVRGLWVKLSVDYLDDPKILAAGIEGEVLFLRGLAWAKKQKEPVIPEIMLGRIGYGLSDVNKAAARLVELNLWTLEDGNYRVTKWDDWQVSPQQLRKSMAGSWGSHRRWHTEKIVEGCEYCARAGTAEVAKFSEHARRLCDLLAELMTLNGCKPPKITNLWLQDMDAILRIDNRNPDTVEAVIRWAQADGFWRSNILSPGKLRKQFDTLQLRRGAFVVEVKPVQVSWVADKGCMMCGGEGLVEVEENTWGPCVCRRQVSV